MQKFTLVLFAILFCRFAPIANAQVQSSAQAQSGAVTAAPVGYLPRYKYQVTDIATRGLDAQQLFNELPASWMDLHHSVCANRAHVWGYDLYRRHQLNVGRIFIFFTADVWASDKKTWMYHAGTYIVDHGVEKVLERSYPDETHGPQTIVEWMDTEMEGRADAKACLEITDADTDLTAYFYNQQCLPPVRANGKPGAPCYYRKVPGYIPYPATVAELEFGVDAKGKPIDYNYDNGFDFDDVMIACQDAYAGRDFFKKTGSRDFCRSFLR